MKWSLRKFTSALHQNIFQNHPGTLSKIPPISRKNKLISFFHFTHPLRIWRQDHPESFFLLFPLSYILGQVASALFRFIRPMGPLERENRHKNVLRYAMESTWTWFTFQRPHRPNKAKERRSDLARYITEWKKLKIWPGVVQLPNTGVVLRRTI